MAAANPSERGIAIIKAEVDPALHRKAKVRAAGEGISIRCYLIGLIERDLAETGEPRARRKGDR
jgi:predicted HicB family RNase H-like nuclease